MSDTSMPSLRWKMVGSVLYLIVILLHAPDAQADGMATATARWAAADLELLQELDGTASPVEKVVKLLTDMRSQLDADRESDAKINDEMVCWCNTNERAKTHAIQDYSEKSSSLTALIKNLEEKSSELHTEIDKLTVELDTSLKELDTAVALRKKEVAEFTTAEEATHSSIKQLDGATEALTKGMPAMMQQSAHGEVALHDGDVVTASLKTALQGHKHDDLRWAIHKQEEQRILQELMGLGQSHDVSLLQTSGTRKILSAPFDMVRGTISGLRDAFHANLKDLQSNEADSSAAHEAMKTSKKEQISAGTAMLEEKKQLLADTGVQIASAKEDLEDTNSELLADQSYLKNVREQCTLHAVEYKARVKTQNEEVEAISGALEVLTGDDARNLFTKTLGHSKGGDKLGSRDIAEYKEDRSKTSLRSQTNANRKAKWGTSDRYFFLQVQKAQHTTGGTLKSGSQLLPQAQKLKRLAARSAAYWSSQYSSDGKALGQGSHNTHASVAIRAADVLQRPSPLAPKALELPKARKLNLATARSKSRGKSRGPGAEGTASIFTLREKTEQMADDLTLEQGEETNRYDWCVDEVMKLEKEMDEADRDLERTRAKIKTMTNELKDLEVEVKNLVHDQEDADVELQMASNDRKEQNTAYQEGVMNQKSTIGLLQTAMKFLKSFYDKKQASLIHRARITRKTSWDHLTADIQLTSGWSQDGRQEGQDGEDAQSGKIMKGEKEMDPNPPLPSNNEDFNSGEVMPTKSLAYDDTVSQAPTLAVPDVMPDAASEGAAAAWLTKWSNLETHSSDESRVVLLQSKSHVGIRHPTGQVADMLQKAHEESADADEMIQAARALAAQSRQQSMLQSKAAEPSSRPPPPPGFKAYKENGASGGVMVMLENLIDDAEAMIKEAIGGEKDALVAYEEIVNTAAEATTQRSKGITDRRVRIGKLERFIMESKERVNEIMDQKASLRQYDVDLHGPEGCDYLMKNYAARQEARQNEIDTLKRAYKVIDGLVGDQVLPAGNPEPSNLEKMVGGAEAMEEAEEAEEAQRAASSEFSSVPEGVDIVGPNREHAISKMPR